MKQASILTKQEYKRLLSIVESNKHAERNKAVVFLSFYAGLRACEIASLHFHDVVNDENNTLEFKELYSLKKKNVFARIFKKEVIINKKTLVEYFTIDSIRAKVIEPLVVLSLEKEFDVKVNVNGGGFKGQAEAIRMGIARALVELDEEHRKPLKEKKFLTRDARVVERKKYGKPKARKSFQFSKR